MFITDKDLDFLPIPDPEVNRIRNTVQLPH